MEQDVPLFPLKNVLFPGGQLELQVFEPRYLSLVGECMREEREFGIVLIEEGEEAGATPSIYPVGCSARITNFDSMPNGFLGISVEGVRRFKVLDHWARKEDLQIRADIEWIESPKVPIPEAYSGLTELLKQVLQQQGASMPKGKADAAWMVFRVAEVLPLSDEQKMELLVEPDPQLQLQRIAEILDSMFN